MTEHVIEVRGELIIRASTLKSLSNSREGQLRMSRRMLKSMILTLCLSVALVQAAGAQTTITYSAWGNEQELAIERALIEAFERENPDIRVELIVPTGNYEETLVVWAAGGVLPDVISLNHDATRSFAGSCKRSTLREPTSTWACTSHRSCRTPSSIKDPAGTAQTHEHQSDALLQRCL